MLTVVSKIPGTVLERKGYVCRSRSLLLIKSPMDEPKVRRLRVSGEW
jgi:hypothetical protein